MGVCHRTESDLLFFTFSNIYNHIIFPTLNHAYRTLLIGQWIESTWSVQFLSRKTRATSMWRHKITSKWYEEVKENWHSIFIDMMSLPAFSRENFRIFFSGALRKGFMLADIVILRNECLIFLHSWEMNLGEAVTNLPRNASRFTGFVTCLTQVHFPWTQKKDTNSLNVSNWCVNFDFVV